MAFRTLALAGLLVIAGFVVQSGLGSEFGVLQEVELWEDRYPSQNECDWNETGTLVNLETTQGCELTIQDLSSTHAQVDVDRYKVDTESEFRNGYSSTQDVIYNTSSDYGGYIATGSNPQDTQYYSTSFYIPEAEDIQVEYEYQEKSSPVDATLELYDVTNSQVRDSVSLTDGSPNNDYLQETSLTPQNSGDHQLRLTLNGTEDQQRIYRVYAYQNGSALSGVASGKFEGGIGRAADDVYIDRLEFQGDDITEIGVENQKEAKVFINGYNDGNLEEQREFVVENDVEVVDENRFFSNTSLDAYSLDIVMISEGTGSPETSYVFVKGGQFFRAVDNIPGQWLRTFIFMLFLGLALAYVASEL